MKGGCVKKRGGRIKKIITAHPQTRPFSLLYDVKRSRLWSDALTSYKRENGWNLYWHEQLMFYTHPQPHEFLANEGFYGIYPLGYFIRQGLLLNLN